jgi:hypothetical protein
MEIISEARERAPNHPSPPFKEKEKGGEGGSMFGGQWKIPCLVVNGRSHAWWSWNVKEKHLFTSSNFP